MKLFPKLGVLTCMLFTLSAISALAQTDNEVIFQAPFAFYAGDVVMPAGSYTLTSDDSTKVLFINSEDGSHSALVEYELVDLDTPPSKTEITFNKYGDTDFLDGITVKGDESKMRILTSRAEKDAAQASAVEAHSVAAKGGR
jgi:hypothetical protein